MSPSASLLAKLGVALAASLLLIGSGHETAAEPAASTMLVHGNYCGLGNNAPLPPVDALDAACARHDACTPDESLPTKSCDARLEEEARALAQSRAAGPLAPDGLTGHGLRRDGRS